MNKSWDAPDDDDCKCSHVCIVMLSMLACCHISIGLKVSQCPISVQPLSGAGRAVDSCCRQGTSLHCIFSTAQIRHIYLCKNGRMLTLEIF